ncbi:hypothetical protein BTO30_13225 [Domibacillus antri]|uniref:Uncharacterized protein n=1 Tax=Domibacillus antri TaxID=1714264 RepID=A0A1Q8Q380_9BACI|nr:hypothetical protein [Domibacillus antri]OLN21755.1 hypothetical protein BTO30_13225 [Domibacillus antri]
MNIIPRKYEQEIPYEVFGKSVLNEEKVQFTGTDFWWSDEEMKEVILMLVFSIGLQRLIQILPDQSREELVSILLLGPET